MNQFVRQDKILGDGVPLTNIPFDSAPSIKTNFSWMLLGNLFYGFCQWGFLIVLAKLTGPDIVGRFSIGLAVSAPIIMLMNMQVRSVQATDAGDAFGFSEYLGFRILTSGIAFVILCVILLFCEYSDETSLVILIIGMSKIFEAISDIFMGYFQKNELMNIVSKSMMIRGVSSLAAFSITIYLTKSLICGVTVITIAWACVLFFYDMMWFRSVKIKISSPVGVNTKRTLSIFKFFETRFSLKKMWRIASLTIPLGVISLLLSLNTNIPKYYIEHFLGQEALGYFATMAYLILIGAKFINAISQAVMPKLSRLFLEKNKEAFSSLFYKVTCCCALLGISVVIMSICLGDVFLSVFYGVEYVQYKKVFVWILVSGALEYLATFFWLSLITIRQIKIQVPYNLFYILFLSLLCFLLIPKYNISGAAYAMVCTNFLKVSCNFILNKIAIKNLD